MPLKATFPKNFENQDLEGAPEGKISKNRDLDGATEGKIFLFLAWSGILFL